MKNTQIENLIKQLRFKTTAETRDRILNNVLSTCRAESQPHHPNIWRIIFKSKITRFAVAACIVIIIFVFFTHHSGRPRETLTLRINHTPAELMTLASLNIALRNGGIDAVDKQLDQAFEKLGPWPVNSQSQIIPNYTICMHTE
jgi:hypothetical protein